LVSGESSADTLLFVVKCVGSLSPLEFA